MKKSEVYRKLYYSFFIELIEVACEEFGEEITLDIKTELMTRLEQTIQEEKEKRLYCVVRYNINSCQFSNDIKRKLFKVINMFIQEGSF